MMLSLIFHVRIDLKEGMCMSPHMENRDARMTCPKCAGLMVEERPDDLEAGQIGLQWRCLNCGRCQAMRGHTALAAVIASPPDASRVSLQKTIPQRGEIVPSAGKTIRGSGYGVAPSVPTEKTASVLVANRLLAALPPTDLARLQPDLEPIIFPFKYELTRPGEAFEYVYFPFHGVMSLIVPMTTGETVEVSLVGNEGMVGIHAYLGDLVAPWQVICQVPGDGVRMKVATFQKEVGRGRALAAVVRRFFEEFLIQLVMTGACNRLHTSEQRCARWLLMTLDRTTGTTFPITQEFLASMLGIRRAGVNVVMASLKRNGIIRYSRGKLVVLERAGLETIACECYKTVTQASERITHLTLNPVNLGPSAETINE
jgi:CRP-like cAMP-binding protein